MWDSSGDPTRRAIVERLAVSPCAVGELASELPVSRPAVSQHLKVLKDAGLVTEEAAGTRRIYRLNPAGVSALRDQLDTFWNRALTGFETTHRHHPRGDHIMSEAPSTVNRHVVVTHPPAAAFATFTERFGDFKPKEHNMLGVEIADTIFEPHVGGNIYDRGIDGSECRWARILAYDPPHRVVFSWDIGPTWQVEADPELTSEVEVRFIAEADDRTRVELDTATSTATAPDGKASPTASATTKAGRSTSTATPRSSTRLRRALT